MFGMPVCCRQIQSRTNRPMACGYAIALLLLVSGCGAHNTAQDAGQQHLLPQEQVPAGRCDALTQLLPLMAGHQVLSEGGHAHIKLASMQPAEAVVGENAWVLSLSDAEFGEPLAGASVEIEPRMPDHGHGIVPPAYRCVSNVDGMCTLPSFVLNMPGIWAVTLRLEHAGWRDEARLRLCVEG